MNGAMAHRGPDGEGEFRDDVRGVALAHRRLSILDLSDAAAQPMRDDSGAILVYNGELYNFREIRRELEVEGHRFRSTGDAEVVLKALVAWGRAALERFAGMFALAYVAPGSSRVLLARDPLGIKPLMLAPLRQGGGVLFASELRALLASDVIDRRIDAAAMAQYLEFGYAFDGRRGMVRGVEKVAPGEVVELERGRIVTRSHYYTLPAQDPQTDHGDAETHLLDTLRSVVAEHLVADVPVGVLLSGGLDSSVVAALAAQHTRVRTVSFGFERSATDEREQARLVAQAIGSDHTEFTIAPEEAVAELEHRAEVFDDLIDDGATLSTRLAYRQARREGLKVVLVGEGADELFGGYPTFGAAGRLRGPALWRRWLLYRRYAGRRYGSQFGDFSRCLGSVGSSAEEWIEAVRHFELRHQVPNQFVMKVDHASMSESVEARTPFLDRRVVAAGRAFGSSALGVDAEGKRPLRAVAARFGLLPAATVTRPKFGTALASEWLESDPSLRALASRVLLPRGSVTDRLGLRREVEAYLVHGRLGLPLPSPFGVLGRLVWRLLVFQLWSQRLALAL
jgi:asparagine synthase (glutamine-hydrolysing)